MYSFLSFFCVLSADGSEKKGLSVGVIAGIIIVVVLVIILIAVATWYMRSRSRFYRGNLSMSYYKDMSTKPLEEDFDDDETTKVFDDRGSREKVEFA